MTLPWKLEALGERYSHHAAAAIFLLGFFFDIFTLPRIDHPAVPYIILGHMTIIGASIILNRILMEKESERFDRIQPIFPLLTSFSFGALLSFLFIYFARSAAPGASWPFLVLLAAIMVGSEVFRKKLEGLRFYVILYGFLWVMLSVLMTPTVIGGISHQVFFASLVVGILCFALYLFVLFLVTNRETRYILPKTILSVALGVFLIVLSYLSHIMPAIPLVLKEGEVYTHVEKLGTQFIKEGTHRRWYEGLLTRRVHQWTRGTPVYFFSAVFAPARVEGNIVHDWQRKDAQGSWVSVSQIAFPISGGREEGYRGYSLKENITPGEWRVVVRLSDGRVVGRVTFLIVER